METILAKVNKEKKQRFEMAVKSAVSYWESKKENGYNKKYCENQVQYFKDLKY